MGDSRLIRAARHPAFALSCAALFALAAFVFIRGGVAVHDELAAANDPVKVSDRALARVFDRNVAEREIRAALAAGDVNLAESFVALAADRGVAIDPALADAVKDASAPDCSSSSRGPSANSLAVPPPC